MPKRRFLTCPTPPRPADARSCDLPYWMVHFRPRQSLSGAFFLLRVFPALSARSGDGLAKVTRAGDFQVGQRARPSQKGDLLFAASESNCRFKSPTRVSGKGAPEPPLYEGLPRPSGASPKGTQKDKPRRAWRSFRRWRSRWRGVTLGASLLGASSGGIVPQSRAVERRCRNSVLQV
jgi:hypothetical protein